MTNRLTASLLLALTLAACGPDAPAPPVGAASAAAAAKKKQEPPEPAAPVSTVDYAYVPLGKRDPFRSPALDQGASGVDKNEDVVCNEPLCQVDVDDLVVVAVVTGDANPLAMVEDRAGVGYIVRRNSKIGRQGGKVTQVLRDCVVVTSFITGPDGKGQPNKASLCVRQDPRSQAPMDLFQGKPFQ
jgi:type IV pilus assembly protein PilP